MIAARKLEPELPIDADDTGADPHELGEEWEAEIERRIEEHRAGRGRSYTLEEIDAEIRAKYGWE